MLVKRKIMLALVASGLCVTTAMAADTGIYLGAAAGYSDVNEGGSDTGLAGRVFGGYQFNKNFAAELGYTMFHDATESGSAGGMDYSAKVETQAVDLAVKGILPINDKFSLYGKLGIAYMYAKASATINSYGYDLGSASDVYPEYGLGASYKINDALSADVSWTRIQHTGDGDIPSADFAGLGLTYSFG